MPRNRAIAMLQGLLLPLLVACTTRLRTRPPIPLHIIALPPGNSRQGRRLRCVAHAADFHSSHTDMRSVNAIQAAQDAELPPSVGRVAAAAAAFRNSSAAPRPPPRKLSSYEAAQDQYEETQPSQQAARTPPSVDRLVQQKVACGHSAP